MKFTTTLILLVLVVALALYLMLVDRYKPSTEELERVEKRVVQQFEPDRVTGIEIDLKERAGGTGDVIRTETFVLERGLSGWNIIQPFNFPADETIIRSMLDQVKKIDRSRILVGDEYKQLDRKAAGLEDPDVVATFYQPDTSLTFRIGGTVPSVANWDNYVEVAGRDACFFVPTVFRDALLLKSDSSARDVRSRKVFDLRKYMVNSLVLEHPAMSIELRRGDDLVWRVVQPVQDVADTEKAEQMVEDLSELQVSTYLEPTNFGRAQLTLNVGEGAASQRLLIGPRESEGEFSYYPARRAEYQQYFTIDAKALEPFMGGPNDYRSRLLVVRNAFEQPEGMTQEVGGDTLVAEAHDDVWGLAGSESPLIDSYKVEDYVYRWNELTITSFVEAATAQAALSDTWIRLTFKYKDLDQTKSVVVSRPVDGLAYSERSPGVYVALDEGAVQDLLATNELAFLNEEIYMVPRTGLSECRAVLDGVEYVFMQGSNGWAISVSNTIANVRSGISDVLDSEHTIEVARYVAKVGDEGLAQYGLAQPVEEYILTDKRGYQVTLRLGDETPDGVSRYVMRGGQPFVGILTEKGLAQLADFADIARLAAEQAVSGSDSDQ